MEFSRLNNLLASICAFIAFAVYVASVEPTVSWWDTGEFIASSYKLQVVHQPGAPLFLMIQNLFSNFALGDVSQMAKWMNIGSACCSALTVLFLFLTISAFAQKFGPEDKLDFRAQLSILSAAAIGSLAYAFTDTFWFSAVESEVYAMSSLCTAVVFWAILKWEKVQDDRWLLFIAYMMGLSIGVHLLNLLVIPAIALVIYFKKNKETTWLGGFKAFFIGLFVLACILWGVIQYLIKAAAYTDLFFVNSLGMPFGSGLIVYTLVGIGLLIYLLVYSVKQAKPLLNILLLGFTFIVLGYSSFAMIVIRAGTDISLNNNNPNQVFSFLSYLNRDQYGQEPLLSGRYFDSKVIAVEEGAAKYRQDANKYAVSGHKMDVKYDKTTIFPRIYGDQPYHQDFYRHYLQLAEGESPDFVDNLKFFFGYQMGHMYWRYFMWNFSGRQNDVATQGGLTSGNWITGISSLDNIRLGGQDHLPESERTHPSRNSYFALPFLLGLLGLIGQLRHRPKDALIVGLFFFFTGLAIVLYLNQTPYQPRERDYAYVGSFYAFSIWIGLGVFTICQQLTVRKAPQWSLGLVAALCLLAVPLLLLVENWDDHNRSGKYIARDFAQNYLESCAPNAILFTYGDNDTFPLWYLQEVEGVRTDVRIVNLSYLDADWYMKQTMLQKVNDAEALPLNIDYNLVKEGVRDYISYYNAEIPGYVRIQDILSIVLSEDNRNKLALENGQFVNFLPTKNFELHIDKDQFLAHQHLPEQWKDALVDRMQWQFNKEHLMRGNLSILALLANNNFERPIYFSFYVPQNLYAGLDNYLVSEGFALRIVPIDKMKILPTADEPLVDADTVYKNIKTKYAWGNLNSLNHVDPESSRYVSLVLDQIYNPTIFAFMRDQQFDKAREMAVSAYEQMPKRIFSMMESASYSSVADSLYKLGEAEKGQELASRNLNYIDEQLSYFHSIAQIKPNGEYRNSQIGLYLLNEYEKIAAASADPTLLKKVEAIKSKYSKG